MPDQRATAHMAVNYPCALVADREHDWQQRPLPKVP